MTKEVEGFYPHGNVAYADLGIGFQEGSAMPSEALMQAIWFHQRLKRDLLLTTDGRGFRVLHPGFWNREAGPDFRQAILQWDDGTVSEGDIEVDLFAHGWSAHGHAQNPTYRNVILQVVWIAGPSTGRPMLELHSLTDTSLPVLRRWHGSERAAAWPIALAGQCRLPLHHLRASEQEALLRQAAEARFQFKADRLSLRAQSVGWDQSLWEYVFRALGYKQNFWPMQHVGEWLPRLHRQTDNAHALLAKCLGAAGLLPSAETLEDPQIAAYVHEMREIWETFRPSWTEHPMPKSAWRLHHLRPANRPERRLALAAQWVSDLEWTRRLEQWAREGPLKRQELMSSLREALGPVRDTFWDTHWTFRAEPFSRPRPLLGVSRLTDLAVNVLLPWLYARATLRGDISGAQSLMNRFFEWPNAQDNAVLRFARKRFWSGCPTKTFLRGAAAQQGLLQIVNDFCDHSNALCQHCPFPEWVATWGG